jgi:DNA-binding transcriptional regulator YiaG
MPEELEAKIMDLEDLVLARDAWIDGRGRSEREKRNLSLRDTAPVVGVDAATFSRWERGLSAPRGEAARKYGRLLRTWIS